MCKCSCCEFLKRFLKKKLKSFLKKERNEVDLDSMVVELQALTKIRNEQIANGSIEGRHLKSNILDVSHFKEGVLSGDPTLQPQINDLKLRADYVEPKIRNMETKMSTIEPKISNIETRLNASEPKISNLETRIVTIEPKVTSLESKVVNIEPTLNQVNNTANTALTVANSNSQRINNMLAVNPTFIQAYKATAQNISASVWTKVVFDGEVVDDFNEFANSRFTALQDGRYTITAGVKWEATGEGQRYALAIYRNGASFSEVYDMSTAGKLFTTIGAPLTSSGSASIKLIAGDYIEVYVWSSGTAKVAQGVKEAYIHIVKSR